MAELSFRGSIHVQVFLIPLGDFGGAGLPHSILSMPAMYIIPFVARATDMNESRISLLQSVSQIILDWRSSKNSQFLLSTKPKLSYWPRRVE